MTDFPPNLTWDEFLSLPQETRNASLVDGEVVVNPPNAPHEVVVRNLHRVFMDWIVAGEDRGDVSTQQAVKINDRRGYQPDFLWYPQEHCSPANEPAAFSGPPSLLVEVLSPSTRRYDQVRKRNDYESIGIPEVWFIDHEVGHRSALVCHRPDPADPYVDKLLGDDDVVTSAVLEGFAVPVVDLFTRYPRPRT